MAAGQLLYQIPDAERGLPTSRESGTCQSCWGIHKGSVLGCEGHIWKKLSEVVFDKNPCVLCSEEDKDGASDCLVAFNQGNIWIGGGMFWCRMTFRQRLFKKEHLTHCTCNYIKCHGIYTIKRSSDSWGFTSICASAHTLWPSTPPDAVNGPRVTWRPQQSAVVIPGWTVPDGASELTSWVREQDRSRGGWGVKE